jgi:hypothetical protein
LLGSYFNWQGDVQPLTGEGHFHFSGSRITQSSFATSKLLAFGNYQFFDYSTKGDLPNEIPWGNAETFGDAPSSNIIVPSVFT